MSALSDFPVRLRHPGNFHLTYCTNIHPADGWKAVLASLERYAPALKARFAPESPFGIGLRLSARDGRELLEGTNLRDFRAFLDDQGLYVAIVNGFPYGPFHGTPVKAAVYAPDWRDEARARYTLDLVEIVRALVPEGLDGGVSTAPLSYKPWMANADADAWQTIVNNVVRVAETLVRIRQDAGTLIHLDIEPEPDCSIENTAETLEFFEQRLLPLGSPLLAAALDVPEEVAREHLLEHIRLCFDCCHFAVEFEDASSAIERIRAAGIRIGRAQLSSALDVPVPADRHEAERVRNRLRAFADTTYLHQVVERRAGGLRHYPDLPDALDHISDEPSKEWRIHFHVPLFTAQYDELGSTQQYVADVLRHLLRTGATRHLEIETYTWNVLPAGLKMDLLESIAREYEWVLATVEAVHGSPRQAHDRPLHL
ncbi:MAG: metabolite traffic protein EboE [Vicinamibacterales bacterium]